MPSSSSRRAARRPMPPQVVKVRVAREVMEQMLTRDAGGNRLRVVWGEPDADGFYEPTVTVDYTDTLARDA